MSDELPQSVAAACRRLDGWPELKAPPGYPKSLALCVVDAIWSMGVRYQGVINVVDRYSAWLAAEGRGQANTRSATELIDDIDRAGGGEKFATLVRNRGRTSSRNGILKASAVYDVASALRGLGLNQAADLRRRYNEPAVEAAWKSVRGQSSGISWHYGLILAGVEDIKADRMVCRFVAGAAGRKPVTPAEAYEAMRQAHEILKPEAPNLTLRSLDHAVWGSQRGR